MVRFEIEISASMGRFSVDFGGQFPDDQNIQKRIALSGYFHSELAGRP
jgi:hypothetical protein